MPVVDIVRSLLSSLSPIVHLKRLEAVTAAVVAVLACRRLSVGAMGREFSGTTTAKHSIKRFDRLASNELLHEELPHFYSALAHQVLEPNQRVVVLVDWTHVTGIFHALVAAISYRGRALVVLSEVRPERQLGNTFVQNAFLKRLKTVLPDGVRAIIVTDAGFHGDVFKTARELGWDFLGRLRGTAHVDCQGQTLTKAQLHAKATTLAKDLGPCRLYKRRSVDARIVVVRRPRSRKKTRHTRNKEELAYRKSCRDPWILVTSLTSDVSAQAVVALYALRMQIEESFRDAKSTRFGLHFGAIRSGSADRLAVMLLLASISMFVAILVGSHAEQMGIHRKFQANTCTRRVLSLFTLGSVLLARGLKLAETTLGELLCKFRNDLALGWAHSSLTFRGDP